jgi:hypothetical protein
MSVSIHFESLFTYAAESSNVRLPLSRLAEGNDHIHGALSVHIAGKPIPSLGFFGPEDVCLNTWTQELHAIEEALSQKQDAIYVFDEGEQGQPAYEFRRDGELLYVSVIDSQISGARGDPNYQQISCLWNDFLISVRTYTSQLQATLQSEVPELAQEWWSASYRGGA